MKNKKRSYKEIEEDMPLSAEKIEDNTFGSCHRYRLLSPYISLYLLLSPIILSCTGSTVFHSYKPLPAEGWDRRDTVCFDVPQQAEDIRGTLFVGLRTVAHIGIQDVALAVEQCDGAGIVSRCDTLRYPLTDAEGNALTSGINNHQYETQQLPFLMRKGKGAHVRIHHLMTPETISGITGLGIRVEAQ